MQCPTHLKKLQKIIEPAKNAICSICSRQAALECKQCTFMQCQLCRICTKKHGMLKIIDLVTIKAEYYNNAYSCNGCSKSKTVDDDGIWHCNTCNYDLCPECSE